MARPILSSAVALTLCALAVGCGRQADQPAPESTTPAAASTVDSAAPVAPLEAADAVANSPQNPPKDETARVRRAIREFIAEKYPSSEVEGVWTLGVRGNYCFAGADTIINGRHRNIDVLVRQYVRDDGSQYWRGEGFDSDTARMLRSQEAPLGEAQSSDEN